MEKERKLQIIRAAIKRFIRHGLKKTTLDEVARDLRIGKATIYHYFRSKEDLYYQTLRFEISQFIAELKIILFDDNKEIAVKLDEYFRTKTEISSRFKLINELLLHILTETEFGNEKDIFGEMLSMERNLLNEFSIKYQNGSKPIPIETEYLLELSWSVSFAGKFQVDGQSGDFTSSLLKLIT